MKNFKSIDVHFKNDKQIELAARLDLPDSEIKGFVIFSPCFTCTKETLATFRISQQLARYHFAVLRLDFTGLGESEGNFADSNFSTQVEDIIAANRFLEAHYLPASLLIGHSMGGTASFAAAMQLDNIKAVVSIASPSHPAHVLHHFGPDVDQLHEGKAVQFEVAGQPYSVNPQFIEHIENFGLPHNLAHFNRASLVFHGEKDRMVGIEQAYQLFEALPQPKSFISLDSADHILSDRQDAQYVADVINSWVLRYLN